MKKKVHIDFSRDRIMHAVEEQAAYIAAKSGSANDLYLNGIVTEPDKAHLDLFVKEALVALGGIAKGYHHEYAEGEIILCMPMNFDEGTVPELEEAIAQYTSLHILRQWLNYVGVKNETYSDEEYINKIVEHRTRISALLNHRRYMPPSHFKHFAKEPLVYDEISEFSSEDI